MDGTLGPATLPRKRPLFPQDTSAYKARKIQLTMERQRMTTLVFGHKSPDTDSTGSPII